MQNKYKIITFAAASLFLGSATISSAAMAGNNVNTYPISSYGSGGGLLPDPYGSGDGLRPDPYGSGDGLGPIPLGSGGGLFPDPLGSGDGLTPDPYGSGGGLGPDPKYRGIIASGSGGGLRPDPASTEGPKPLYCLLGWCLSAN